MRNVTEVLIRALNKSILCVKYRANTPAGKDYKALHEIKQEHDIAILMLAKNMYLQLQFNISLDGSFAQGCLVIT